MAETHIEFDDTLKHGRLLRDALNQLENGRDKLKKILGTMTLMVSGDGSTEDQFGDVVAKFRFPDNATAKMGWDELNSLFSKINTDADVTAVMSALEQAFRKFM